jgi:transketolase
MTAPADLAKLTNDARAIRRQFLEMHFRARSGHIGSGLSAIDLLTYVYGHELGAKDVFLLSKGHAASALYATLHHFEKLSAAEIATYYQDGTKLPAHPAAGAIAGITAATGSLGHGLPIATGLAFARKKLARSTDKVIALLSDGECNEGSTWEAALFAGHHRLDNLTVVIDANGLQGFGRTTEVLDMEPFAAKWTAFGFDVRECDGHDFAAIHSAFTGRGDKPRAVVARTVKGKGVAVMEDRLEWHYLPMNDAQFAEAIAGLAKEGG